MNLYYFYTLKALWYGQGKIKIIMGCPGLKSSYHEKGLFDIISSRKLKRYGVIDNDFLEVSEPSFLREIVYPLLHFSSQGKLSFVLPKGPLLGPFFHVNNL